MHLWRTKDGIIVNDGAHTRIFQEDWDALINREALLAYLASPIPDARPLPGDLAHVLGERPASVLPPIGSQEVWAAGVTYFRSRSALPRSEAPVPTICTNASSSPSVCAQISSAMVWYARNWSVLFS